MSMLYALFLTVVIEGLIMLALTRSKKWLYYNFLCNLLTNPLLNLALSIVWSVADDYKKYWTAVAIGEVLVFVGEAHLYRAMTGESKGKCYFRSIATNGASFLIGLFVM